MKKYETMTDEQLIRKFREGDTAIIDFIMDKYKFLVKSKAKDMYLLGGENDDLIQEGMIGLFKAVRDFDWNQETSFYSFALLCITRQMDTAIKNSLRQKHIPLNSYVSIYEAGEKKPEGKEAPLIEKLQTEMENNPEELVLSKEYFHMLREKLEKKLSPLEQRVLHLYLRGEDYRTIAKLLDKSPRSIDNALQRIKKKMSVISE